MALHFFPSSNVNDPSYFCWNDISTDAFATFAEISTNAFILSFLYSAFTQV